MWKKILPNIVISLFIVFFCLTILAPLAQADVSGTGSTANNVDSSSADAFSNDPNANGPQFDKDVTFAGKTAVRSQHLLDWVISNYQWAYIANGQQNPFTQVWVTIRNIVYALLTLTILAAAFLIIITRGENIGIRKFIVRFVLVVVLITLSFAIVQFIYTVADVIQSFFLIRNGKPISADDLLKIGFDYDFNGIRIYAPKFANDESAFMSILLVKATAITYYAMFGVLMLRKVILWFFIILSPIFPILLLFSPVRNSAKLWLGEFFRWVLYAPLFAVLLSGLVVFWANWHAGTPLRFDYQNNPPANVTDKQKLDYTLPCTQTVDPSKVIYPTAINILLGGPCQAVDFDNNLNVPASFIQYVVALIMLWMVIILPFILLKIFLDYIKTISLEDNGVVQYLNNNRPEFLERYGLLNPKTSPTPPSPRPPASTGEARALPNLINWSASEQTSVEEQARMTAAEQSATRMTESANQMAQTTDKMAETFATQSSTMASNINELSQMINVAIPTMSDIARYEASMMSTEAPARQETSRLTESLNRIAGVSQLTTSLEKEQYSHVREQIIQKAQTGDSFASAVLNASYTSSSANIPLVEQLRTELHHISSVSRVSSLPSFASFPVSEKYDKITESLKVEAKTGNPVASAVLAAASAASPTTPDGAAKQAQFVQNYEEVAKATEAVSQSNAPEDQKVNQIRQTLAGQAKTGNKVAVSLLTVIALSAQRQLPDANRLQQVNMAEYDKVRKTWEENYRRLEVPGVPGSVRMSRKEWLNQEISQIPQVISLLQSPSLTIQQQGMQMVSRILPFLLLGGFSKAEVAAYLKAKQEAARHVLTELGNDDDKLLVDNKKTEQLKSMHIEDELTADDNKPVSEPPKI